MMRRTASRMLPDRIAAARISHPSRPAGTPPPPIGPPLEVDAEGYALLIDPCTGGDLRLFVHVGIRLVWKSAPALGGVIVHIVGGPAAEPGVDEPGIAFFISLPGMDALIDDLQLIRGCAIGLA